MKTPPLLLGTGLLFWGWQTGLLIPAVAIALLLEAHRLTDLRLDLKPRDFTRIADLSTVIMLGLFVYLYFSGTAVRAVLLFIQWLPLGLLPLIAAQVYSSAGKIDGSALFWSLRKTKTGEAPPYKMAFDLTYPYLALCLLSAAAANIRTPVFYAGMFVLVAWGLWPARSRRFSPVSWCVLLAAAGIAGYMGQAGLHGLQGIVENKVTSWFMGAGQDDPYQATTSIGDIGRLKMSDGILARVKIGEASKPPSLLRTASYDTYRGTAWYALNPRFRQLSPEADGATWKLASAAAGSSKATIYEYLRKGKGVLKLPAGTTEISGLPAGKVMRNQFGAVKVEEGPGAVSYMVIYGSPDSLIAAPAASDLAVPAELRPHLERIAASLVLSPQQPAEALQNLSAFFQKNFKYSLTLSGGKGNPLVDFLERTRVGHCEYFATSTVLILRSAGIPARYSVGYSVAEFSSLEGCHIVRDRFAHAWAQAYVNGVWLDFDTTPAEWVRLENDRAPAWLPLNDFISWCSFLFTKMRAGDWSQSSRYLLWIITPVALYLLYRLIRRPFRFIKRKKAKAAVPGTAKGLDSEFYQVEKRLAQIGWPRQRSETLTAWLARIEGRLPKDFPMAALREVVELHCCLRFDPQGLSGEQRELLKQNALALLGKIEGQ